MSEDHLACSIIGEVSVSLFNWIRFLLSQVATNAYHLSRIWFTSLWHHKNITVLKKKEGESFDFSSRSTNCVPLFI